MHKALNNGSASRVKFTVYKQTLYCCWKVGIPAAAPTKYDSGPYDCKS